MELEHCSRVLYSLDWTSGHSHTCDMELCLEHVPGFCRSRDTLTLLSKNHSIKALSIEGHSRNRLTSKLGKQMDLNTSVTGS